MRLKTVCALLTALLGGSRCCAQSFYGLGVLPNPTVNASEAHGLSANGQLAVGVSGQQAFGWTPGGGLFALPTPAGATTSIAWGVNGPGSVAVGESGGTPGGSAATLWYPTGTGLASAYLYSPSVYSTAYAVSNDGTVAVGSVIPSVGNGAAVRWQVNYSTGVVTTTQLTPATGLNSATGVSGSGQVVVGVSNGLAFRWASGLGLSTLGDLPGGATDSGAQGVSRDGLVVVGYGTDAIGRKAARWTQSAGLVSLGALPGSTFSIADAASADGGTIVGKSTLGGQYAAFIWDSAHGMRDLKTVLVDVYGLGPQLQNWSLTEAYAVSDDGRVVAGLGTDPSGYTRAWVADLTPVPEPSFLMLGVAAGVTALALAHRTAKSVWLPTGGSFTESTQP